MSEWSGRSNRLSLLASRRGMYEGLGLRIAPLSLYVAELLTLPSEESLDSE